MVEKVERYKTPDGREFLTREAALRHEAVEAMIAEVPELALIRTKLESSINRISIAAEPLARFLQKTTLEVQPETTLGPCCVNTPRGQDHHTDCPSYNHAEQSGLCDCSAAMNGASDHAVSCPAHVHVIKFRGAETGAEMAKRVSFRG